MAATPVAKYSPLALLRRIQFRYLFEPSAVAPRYTASMAANEYTTGPRMGMNWRVHTTSIPRLAKPDVNSSGRAIGLAGAESTTSPAGPFEPDAERSVAAMTAFSAAAINRVLEKPNSSISIKADPMAPAIAPNTFARYR